MKVETVSNYDIVDNYLQLFAAISELRETASGVDSNNNHGRGRRNAVDVQLSNDLKAEAEKLKSDWNFNVTTVIMMRD